MSAKIPAANPHVAAMSPYVPGEQPQGGGWVKLNTNENPYPPSLRSLEAIRVALVNDGSWLRLYPSPDSAPLREAAGRFHGFDPARIVAGNGSDDILNLIIRAYDHAEASLLAPLAYSEMIMATALGWYIFGDFPDLWTFVGVAILIASAIYISWRERVRHVEPIRDFEQP